MINCSVFEHGGQFYALPMAETRTKWMRFVGPSILIGAKAKLSDGELGEGVLATLAMYRTGVPDEEDTTSPLDVSVKEQGFKSYRAFFKQCLQVSVKETAEGYELTPYERLTKRGEEGAIPGEKLVYSTKDPSDLGRAVRECMAYAR